MVAMTVDQMVEKKDAQLVVITAALWVGWRVAITVD